jgi:methylated-DNA-protein-cysteine methyltransferase-like protein
VPTRPITAAEAYPRIWRVVRSVPRGRVASYAQVAYEAGLPGRARMVGRALSEAGASAKQLPWHRVINAQGRIALPRSSAAYVEQKTRLIAEGVIFEAGDRVSFARYGWKRRGSAPVLD